MSDLAAEYLAAPEERRWDRPLAALRGVLEIDAMTAKGRPAYRVLPRGALVSVRLRADFRYELRVARREKPKDDVDWARWQGEIDVFARELRVEQWERATPKEPSSGVAVLFLEPKLRQAEAKKREQETGDLFGEASPAPSAIGR